MLLFCAYVSDKLTYQFIRKKFQIAELKDYLKKLGADLPEEKSPKGLEDDVRQIIEVCNLCFKEENESDVEIVLNDIMSILLVVSIFAKNAFGWMKINLFFD